MIFNLPRMIHLQTHSGWKLGDKLYYNDLTGSSNSQRRCHNSSPSVCHATFAHQHEWTWETKVSFTVRNISVIQDLPFWTTWIFFVQAHAQALDWNPSLPPSRRTFDGTTAAHCAKVTTSLISTNSNPALKQWHSEFFQNNLFWKCYKRNVYIW